MTGFIIIIAMLVRHRLDDLEIGSGLETLLLSVRHRLDDLEMLI